MTLKKKLIKSLAIFSFQVNPPIAEFQEMGTMVQAHTRDTFYASHSSVIEDATTGEFHTFYCSSNKPFVPTEDPGWNTNSQNTFYGADSVRYEKFDQNLNSISGSLTFLIGNLEFKPSLGKKTLKLLQSPCTSTTVEFRGLYYTFFESFSDGDENAQMVAIHVARSPSLGGKAEVLTTDGWQPLHSSNSRWKPIIRSHAFDNYPAHRTLINQGLSGNQENQRGQGHGNLLWGVGIPSAVVKENSIYLIAWDNVAQPGKCRLQKINGFWQQPPGGSCGSMILGRSADGENFTSTVRPNLPSGELKIINDPESPKHGQFAFFQQILNDQLKAQNRIGLNVIFFTPDMMSMTSWHEMASVPSKVTNSHYWDLGGIVAPRVAGNALGEISPFSRPTLLQMSLPRTSHYTNSNSTTENREIYAWKFKFSTDLSQTVAPVKLKTIKENKDPVFRPVITSVLVRQLHNKFKLDLCGTSFTLNASVQTKLVKSNTEESYQPEEGQAQHFINNYAPDTGHAQFCIRIGLNQKKIQSIQQGNKLYVQIYQPNTKTYSETRIIDSTDLPKFTAYPL